MIYCFKKLKKLRLLHIFFLHYGISLVVGGAVIAGLFLLGGGLQICSIMVLLYMYSQPTIIMLRRMKMYEVRAELRSGSYSMCEKIGIAIEAACLKPQLDAITSINMLSTVISIIIFFAVNDLTLCPDETVICFFVACIMIAIISSTLGFVWFDMIRVLKEEAE